MSDPRPRPLPNRVRLTVALLLIVPVVGLLLVPTYASETPKLWGFPFFYWYQLLRMFLETAMVYAAYLLITRARAKSGERR